jgi:hypothetical protein
MNFSGKMRESGTSTPFSGGKTDEWVNRPSALFSTKKSIFVASFVRGGAFGPLAM